MLFTLLIAKLLVWGSWRPTRLSGDVCMYYVYAFCAHTLKCRFTILTFVQPQLQIHHVGITILTCTAPTVDSPCWNHYPDFCTAPTADSPCWNHYPDFCTAPTADSPCWNHYPDFCTAPTAQRHHSDLYTIGVDSRWCVARNTRLRWPNKKHLGVSDWKLKLMSLCAPTRNYAPPLCGLGLATSMGGGGYN